MKNSTQKGFAPILIVILIAVIIGGGVYMFMFKDNGALEPEQTNQQVQDTHTTVATTTTKTDDEKYQELIAKRNAETRQVPPSGFLTPTKVPTGFTLAQSRFTEYSTSWNYQADSAVGTSKEHINFSENNKKSFEQERKTLLAPSTVQNMKVDKEFTYNGTKGVVVANYIGNTNSPFEAWLLYDHNGNYLAIHTTHYPAITADMLIDMLKAMTLAE
jgi:hypothetical protein